MKRKSCLALLAGGAVLGALRAADLFLGTDAQTGFVTAGSVWLRYGVLFGYAALIGVLFAKNPPENGGASLTRPAAVLWAAGLLSLLAGLYGLASAVSEWAAPTTNFGRVESGAGMRTFAFALRLLLALSLLAGAVWYVLLAARRRARAQAPAVPVWGFLALAGFLVLPVLRYAESPSSPQRILRVLPVFTALAALAFLVKLLGAQCVERTPAFDGSLAGAGCTAFFLCTCIELPQAVWMTAHAAMGAAPLTLSLLLGSVGVLGACSALAVCSAPRRGEQPADGPAAPAADDVPGADG